MRETVGETQKTSQAHAGVFRPPAALTTHRHPSDTVDPPPKELRLLPLYHFDAYEKDFTS